MDLKGSSNKNLAGLTFGRRQAEIDKQLTEAITICSGIIIEDNKKEANDEV